MITSLERIKGKSAEIKRSRQSFIEKLDELQNSLVQVLGGVEVYGQSVTITLEVTGFDDSIYGHLFYSKNCLKVASRSTADDLADSYDMVAEEDQTFKVFDLVGCPVEWLERLATERVMNSLLNAIEQSLDGLASNSQESVAVISNLLESQSNTVSEELIDELQESDGLLQDWVRAREQIQVDPSGSITRTSSYLESVCRMVLNEQSLPLPNRLDMPSLINAASNSLSLADDLGLERDIKQLFGGIKSIAQAVGAMRTHFGTAHGSCEGDHEIDVHSARLASDAAASISVFLLQRLKEKKLPI